MPQGKIGIEDLGQELKNKINKTIDIADGVENGDFTYVHPNNSQTRHVTDLEKATWNDKADKKVATSSEHGLMSNADKIKLDGIAVNANNYSHPGTHPASMISIADTSNLFTATDVEGALKEVFTNASNGKQQIVNAITGAGGTANSNMSFQQLAGLIGELAGGPLKCHTETVQVPTASSHNDRSFSYTLPANLASRAVLLITTGAVNSICTFNTTETTGYSLAQRQYPGNSSYNGWWKSISNRYDDTIKTFTISAGYNYIDYYSSLCKIFLYHS